MILNIDAELEDRDKSAREIQRLTSDYQQKLSERIKVAQDSLQKEGLNRCAFLASISVELQRILFEIESKISFIKNLYQNADHATFIAMSNCFNEYMKKDLLANLEMIMGVNTENIGQNLYKVEKIDMLENKLNTN
jgi:hypothetical protein